jgi:hypothetical protein
VLVPVLFFLVTGVLGLVVSAILLAIGGRGPGAMSLGARVGVFVSVLLMVLFFGRVARGLVAAMRGREVPHLLPPRVMGVLGIAMGLGVVALGVHTVLSGDVLGSLEVGATFAMGLAFLGYGSKTLWFPKAPRRTAPPAA